MVDQGLIEELLVDWSLKRADGQELSAEELGQEHPELIPELKQKIKDLKQMDWIESESSVSAARSAPSVKQEKGGQGQIETDLSLEEFVKQLIESNLLSADRVKNLQQQSKATSAKAFASQLIKQKELTKYQAIVILEGRDQPLFLDRYLILNEIGSGGMGVVYQALHRKMDRVVAIKILPKAAVDTPEKVKRFHREVKAAARLEHPNIVTAFDAHESNGIHYLVMSYVAGSDLAKLVKKSGPVSQSLAIELVIQAAQGIAHAHSKGVIHRDIKPGNLLLEKNGEVKVLDMGLARMDGPFSATGKTVSEDLTHSGMIMGTVAYLAPEQAADTREADARSDIYSLGCTLYYLLTGRPPYREETMMKTMMAHRDNDIPSIIDIRKDISPGLDIVFQKMIAKNSDDRFQSMEEVILAMKPLQTEDPSADQPMQNFLQSLEETGKFHETSREFPSSVAPLMKTQPNRIHGRWIALGVVTTLLFFAGLLIKLQTAEGLLVLEMDQPELAGAVVQIDGENRITIKTGMGEEQIEVQPDATKHTLKISQDGFETFSKEFQFETAEKKTIKVSLKPLPVVGDDEDGFFGGLDVVENMKLPDLEDVPDLDNVEPQPNLPADPDALAKGGIPLPGDGEHPNYSLLFDGVDDYVMFDESFRFDPNAPFTIEAWVRFDGNTKGKHQTILSSQPHRFGMHNGKNKWQHFIKDDIISGASQGVVRSGNNQVRLGQVHHFATVWEGNAKGKSLKLYVDGKLKRMLELKVPLVFQKDSGRVHFIGMEALYKGRLPYGLVRGAIDEVRLTSGIRYETDFTPVTRFTPDEQTLALFHFDEGQGDVLKDSSGNGHHGKIYGATWVKGEEK